MDEQPSRYVVGIDLGTTNSAVTYVDTQEQPWQVRVLPLPQLVGPGEIEPRESLPSFHYQPLASQLSTGTLRLPWQKETSSYAVGVFARDEGAKTSGRQIASAKSWLCHPGVDRTADLLPWHGAEDVDRLSPVEASSRYLKHMRAAWGAKFPREPLAEQDIVLTLPASFDEVARELTVEAAARAGLPRVVLIEEPQAAFYAWVYKYADDWDQRVSAGQKILVCDIGGGTTDFTLIHVRRSEVAGNDADRIQFHRVAVGNHLILGGDNLDLALAHHVEQKIKPGGKLEARQWDVLLGTCRHVKETLLGENAPQSMTVNLPGSGSKLIGGGLQVEVTRDEVCQLLVEGFLPQVALAEKPIQRQSGFQEFGLPYASDAAMTRYLAAFLAAHRADAREDTASSDHDPARPDVVLFNGGFFASPLLRDRLLEVLTSWFRDDQHPDWSPVVLDHDRLDLAVARGAAYYGMVRRGDGVRIAASLARSYYVSVAGEEPVAVCLVPGNAEPGQTFELTEQTFQLAISQPVEFPLLVSSTRLADRPGDLLPIDREQMTPMPPIRTVLKTRSRNETGEIPVRLHVHLTEVGTIELWCHQVDSERNWRLQFDIRSALQTDVVSQQTVGEAEGTLDEQTWSDCQRLIANVFGTDDDAKPSQLIKQLADALGASRSQWPMTLLRRIWEALMEHTDGRRISAAHEARWLNLLGYALRPGYGLAVDDWRVTETWRMIRGKLIHGTPAIRAESLILWRRLAGGLSAGQQMALAEPLLAPIRNLHLRSTTGKATAAAIAMKPEESHEVWRLLGSLELLPVHLKVELGDMLLELLPRRRFESSREAMVWTLARLGQRVPVYGPLNTVVPYARAAAWLSGLLDLDQSTDTKQQNTVDQFAVVQLARRTDDRYRDVPNEIRQRVVDWLTANDASEHAIQLVRDGGELDSDEQDRVFGEALPNGLRIQ
ncbi:MAG: Hsp70 family protein [Planctomycetales bacterium]|nr:Hsp70 family protein [Planctomycetales bacterium]